MIRPYSLNSARFLKQGRDYPSTQTEWQRQRAAAPIMPLRARPWWRFWG